MSSPAEIIIMGANEGPASVIILASGGLAGTSEPEGRVLLAEADGLIGSSEHLFFDSPGQRLDIGAKIRTTGLTIPMLTSGALSAAVVRDGEGNLAASPDVQSANLATDVLAFDYEADGTTRYQFLSTGAGIEVIEDPTNKVNGILSIPAGVGMTNEDINSLMAGGAGKYTLSFMADLGGGGGQLVINISGDVVDAFSFAQVEAGWRRYFLVVDLAVGDVIYVKPSTVGFGNAALLDGFMFERDLGSVTNYPTSWRPIRRSGDVRYKCKNSNLVTLSNNECYLVRITPVSVDPTAITCKHEPAVSASRSGLIAHKGDFADVNPVVNVGVSNSDNLRAHVVASLGQTTQGGGVFAGDHFLQPFHDGQVVHYSVRIKVNPSSGEPCVFKIFILNPYSGSGYIEDITEHNADAESRFFAADLYARSDFLNLAEEGGYIIGVYKETDGNNLVIDESSILVDAVFQY